MKYCLGFALIFLFLGCGDEKVIVVPVGEPASSSDQKAPSQSTSPTEEMASDQNSGQKSHSEADTDSRIAAKEPSSAPVGDTVSQEAVRNPWVASPELIGPSYVQNQAEMTRDSLRSLNSDNPASSMVSVNQVLHASGPNPSDLQETWLLKMNSEEDARIGERPTIDIRPHYFVSLSADSVSSLGRKANLSPLDLIWSTDLKAGDECDPRSLNACRGTSFQTHSSGVWFLAPEGSWKSIRVFVRMRNESRLQDSLTFLNLCWSEIQNSPQILQISSASQYPYRYFDVYYALYPYGYFIKRKSFSYRYFQAKEKLPAHWHPYQSGYWAFDESGDMIFVPTDSSRPWLVWTYHYGVWRLTSEGWIWIPFPDGKYRANGVTWLRGRDHMAWSLYSSDFPDAFRAGYAEGFRDGLWLGRNSFESGNQYREGLRSIKASGFIGSDIDRIFVDPAQLSWKNSWDIVERPRRERFEAVHISNEVQVNIHIDSKNIGDRSIRNPVATRSEVKKISEPVVRVPVRPSESQQASPVVLPTHGKNKKIFIDRVKPQENKRRRTGDESNVVQSISVPNTVPMIPKMESSNVARDSRLIGSNAVPLLSVPQGRPTNSSPARPARPIADDGKRQEHRKN